MSLTFFKCTFRNPSLHKFTWPCHCIGVEKFILQKCALFFQIPLAHETELSILK